MGQEYKTKNVQAYMIINAIIQLGAIFAFQYAVIVWPLYIVMVMLGLLIAVQTLGAGFAFSSISEVKTERNKKNNSGLGILISFIYMISCYHIYLIGFISFAWFAFAHVIIQLTANFFGAIKQ